MEKKKITKDRIKSYFESIDNFADAFSEFLSSGDDFYDKIPFDHSDGFEDEFQRRDSFDQLLRHLIITFHIESPLLLDYLREQPESYVRFVKENLLSAVAPKVKSVLAGEGIESKIYASENADMFFDIYNTLLYQDKMFDRFDALMNKGFDVSEFFDLLVAYCHIDHKSTVYQNILSEYDSRSLPTITTPSRDRQESADSIFSQHLEQVDLLLDIYSNGWNAEQFFAKAKVLYDRYYQSIEPIDLADEEERESLIERYIFTPKLDFSLDTLTSWYASFKGTPYCEEVMAKFNERHECWQKLKREVNISDKPHKEMLMGVFKTLNKLTAIPANIKVSLETVPDDIEITNIASEDGITWLGTPAQLAHLMDSLHEKGYIEAPQRTNGERNNEAFTRLITTHINLKNGSPKSVLNNLKDSRITPDNQFKIVIDKLPKCNKS